MAASPLRVSAATRAWRSIAHASGIAEIETLKLTVHSLQAALDAAAVRRTAALASHDMLVAESATAQRSLTSLMQRRDAWEAADVARFTDLTSREHTLARSIEAALTERAAADQGAETAQRAFVDAMHERYRAEHLFGEKTRLLSTYAWLTLTGVNIGLFLLGQVFVNRREAKRSEMLNAVAATAAAAAVDRERASVAAVASVASVAAVDAQRAARVAPARPLPPPPLPLPPTSMLDHGAGEIEEAGHTCGHVEATCIHTEATAVDHERCNDAPRAATYLVTARAVAVRQ